ncbi:helix-turn-helix domain-containing protein [Streptomyces sp. 4N509B]|uniref:helix-turn-helix domain-containing protein n=1 Tax=Streptomyces sp. 4N509B TaxID=3457413 RepID=UPI003FD32C9B
MPQRPKPLDDSASMLAWWGRELRNWREVRRLSQEELGTKVNVSGSYIAKFEKAQRRCPDGLVGRLDDALTAGGALVRLWRRVREDEEHPVADADRPLRVGTPHPAATVPATPFRVGSADIELVRSAARELDAIDQRFGGDVVRRSAQAHLRWLRQLIDCGSYDARLAWDLHAAAGSLTVNLGWYSYDAGRQTEARALFAEGLNTALLLDDSALVCRTLSVMARQAVDLNKGREAVLFCQRARSHMTSWRATPRARSVLAVREAQGHASLGDSRACEASLHHARREWERGPSPDDPDWTHFLNQAELTCLEGMCRIDLGQSARAQRLLVHSARMQDAAHNRNRGMCLVRLAVAALHNGELDHAVAATRQTLALIESGVGSTRTIQQLKTAQKAMTPHRSIRDVRDLLDQISIHVG